jgi:hypothetical protein
MRKPTNEMIRPARDADSGHRDAEEVDDRRAEHEEHHEDEETRRRRRETPAGRCFGLSKFAVSEANSGAVLNGLVMAEARRS